MQNISDKAVIELIKKGEIEQFSHIVNRYTKQIVSYVNRIIFDKNEIDDLVQNTFMKFYKYINQFDVERPVLPYLYQIAKNEIRMYLRAYKKMALLNENVEVLDEKGEVETEVEEVLQSLSEEQKKALQLVYEGHSYHEIAINLKRPINTVKTIIRRARLSLKKYDKTRR